MNKKRDNLLNCPFRANAKSSIGTVLSRDKVRFQSECVKKFLDLPLDFLSHDSRVTGGGGGVCLFGKNSKH
jgi:hypothetical protein